jgi:hypothetical protein
MKLIGYLSLIKDLNAPTEPTLAQRAEVQADPKVVKARRLLHHCTKALRSRCGSVAAAKRMA